MVWKTGGFKPTLQATCCTVASSIYDAASIDNQLILKLAS